MPRFRDIREPKPEKEELRPAPNRRARRSHGFYRTARRGRVFRRQLAATTHPFKGRAGQLRAQRSAEVAARKEDVAA